MVLIVLLLTQNEINLEAPILLILRCEKYYVLTPMYNLMPFITLFALNKGLLDDPRVFLMGSTAEGLLSSLRC